MSKFIKLIEVCEKRNQEIYNSKEISHSKERLLSTVKTKYLLREASINKDHIVLLREDNYLLDEIKNGGLPAGLNENHKFTRIYINCGYRSNLVSVVGDITKLTELINE